MASPVVTGHQQPRARHFAPAYSHTKTDCQLNHRTQCRPAAACGSRRPLAISRAGRGEGGGGLTRARYARTETTGTGSGPALDSERWTVDSGHVTNAVDLDRTGWSPYTRQSPSCPIGHSATQHRRRNSVITSLTTHTHNLTVSLFRFSTEAGTTSLHRRTVLPASGGGVGR